MVDIDKSEMMKHTLHVDKAVWADAKDFLEKVNEIAEDKVFMERFAAASIAPCV